jgi:hypothetical protein
MARGTPSIQRVHARNYIQKEADLRLKGSSHARTSNKA